MMDEMASKTAGRLNPVRAMLDGLEADALAELERAMRLSAPGGAATAAQRRWAELGFLAILLDNRAPNLAGFAIIERSRYDKARDSHLLKPWRQAGVDLPGTPPASAVLQQRYGSWPAACYAADELQPDGSMRGWGRPWPAPCRGKGTGPEAYAFEEILNGPRVCAFSIGRVPSSSDYLRWSLHERALARERGLVSRIPNVRTIYLRFPGPPGSRNRWQKVIAAAGITESAIAQARARWVPGLDNTLSEADGRLLRTTLGSPRSRLQACLANGVAPAEFTVAEIESLLTSEDLGNLQISRATQLANGLDGSLDWLAGRANEPTPTALPTARFNAGAFLTRRREQGVKEQLIRQHLELTVSRYRSLARGTLEPNLRQSARLAALLGCRIAELCLAEMRDELGAN